VLDMLVLRANMVNHRLVTFMVVSWQMFLSHVQPSQEKHSASHFS